MIIHCFGISFADDFNELIEWYAVMQPHMLHR